MVTVKSSESKLTEKHLKLMSLRIRYYVTGARRRNEVPEGKHLDLTDAGKNGKELHYENCTHEETPH